MTAVNKPQMARYAAMAVSLAAATVGKILANSTSVTSDSQKKP